MWELHVDATEGAPLVRNPLNLWWGIDLQMSTIYTFTQRLRAKKSLTSSWGCIFVFPISSLDLSWISLSLNLSVYTIELSFRHRLSVSTLVTCWWFHIKYFKYYFRCDNLLILRYIEECLLVDCPHVRWRLSMLPLLSMLSMMIYQRLSTCWSPSWKAVFLPFCWKIHERRCC